MPTRNYFTRAHLLDKPPKVIKPPKLPRGHFTVVRMADGTGVRQYNTAYLAAQAGRSKGGTNAQSRGTGYRWDSASARKAALKVWATRWRKQRWTGNRTGRRPKMRKAVDHAALRCFYAVYPKHGIQYVRDDDGKGQWIRLTDRGPHVISERTALIHLGHLPSPRKGYVLDDPNDQVPIVGGPAGTRVATTENKETSDGEQEGEDEGEEDEASQGRR